MNTTYIDWIIGDIYLAVENTQLWSYEKFGSYIQATKTNAGKLQRIVLLESLARKESWRRPMA